MRILFVAQVLPWPLDDGTKLRLASVLEALSEIAEVDVFALSGNDVDERQGSTVHRLATSPRPAYRLEGGRLGRWIVGGLPSEFAARDYTPVREALSRFAQPPYDLVWFNRVETFLMLNVAEARRKVLDLDVLEEERIVTRLREAKPDLAARLRLRIDLPRWRRLERKAVRGVDLALVCSDLDRRALGEANVEVLPNGYPDVEPCGRLKVGDPPTFGMIASFTYGPNVDAARYLANEVLPRVRSRIPDARLRLVGSGGDKTLIDLSGRPGVTVTGYVSDLSAELSRLDVVAVPLRWGGGTRVKLLEAFAHRIPVVATRFAARGLDAQPGVQFLAADGVQDFADSVVGLLTDPDVRTKVVRAAHRLFVERYRWPVIQSRVKALAEELSNGGG